MTKLSYQEVNALLLEELEDSGLFNYVSLPSCSIADCIYELEDSMGIDTSDEVFITFVGAIMRITGRAAWEEGNNDGYDTGHAEGLEDGYQEGLEEGLIT